MTRMLPQSLIRLPLAHRGLHDVRAGRIENAMASFQAAISAGYGIELDIQLSADGQAMAFHDYKLDRVTGETGLVREKTAAELTAIQLTGSDGTIPTFREVLAVVDGKVPLLVEIKDQDGAFGTDVGPLEQAVARDLRDYNGECAVMSFNPHSVAEMQRLLPDIPRGLTTDAFAPGCGPAAQDVLVRLRAIADFDRVGASFISHDCNDLDRGRVGALKARGARILCWTIRSSEQEAKARLIAENITFEGYLPRMMA